VVAVGSTEKYVASTEALTQNLKAAGSDAKYVLLEGEDHKDTTLSLADADSELFQAVLQMIKP